MSQIARRPDARSPTAQRIPSSFRARDYLESNWKLRAGFKPAGSDAKHAETYDTRRQGAEDF
jgi:hypothetical protein